MERAAPTPLNRYDFAENATPRSISQRMGGAELDSPRKDSHTHRTDGFEDRDWPLLLRIPVVFFGIPLGITGQAVLWKGIEGKGAACANKIAWIVGLISLVTLLIMYCAKAAIYPSCCIWDWRERKFGREFAHPFRNNFFFIPFHTANLLVLGTPGDINEQLNDRHTKHVLQVIMTLLLWFEVHQYTKWFLSQDYSIRQNNPAYQLAIVGNFIGANALSTYGENDYALFFSQWD
jgi:tellurite resistance protein TehA-like permease